MSSQLSGIFLALITAAIWGSGDFSGGFASRRLQAFQVLGLAAITGSILLLAAFWLLREPLPTAHDAFWALGAGIAGAFGIASLYRALSLGVAAKVAPITAVVGAAIPAVYTAATLGVLDLLPLLGLVLALTGIWLVHGKTGPVGEAKPSQAGLAALAGLAFGGFFIMLSQLEGATVFGPLLLARLAMLATALIGLKTGGLRLPAPLVSPAALLAGLLDASGNVFYFVAQLRTRLDVATVLASLYPVATVLLARMLLRERVSGRQWLGVTTCAASVALIVSG